MTITIEILVGEEVNNLVDQVSQLRIDTFKEYPYLYEGDLEYEKNYMRAYSLDKQSMIAVAKVDGVLAGVSTGIPLISDSEIVADAKQAFSKLELDPQECYYYGEVIVLPQFRNQGIATKLYAEQDKLLLKWGYHHVSILTVVRDNNHPLKPDNYRSPDYVWSKLGFFRNKVTVEYHWRTIQTDKAAIDQNNTLEFWTKNLTRPSVNDSSHLSSSAASFKYSS